MLTTIVRPARKKGCICLNILLLIHLIYHREGPHGNCTGTIIRVIMTDLPLENIMSNVNWLTASTKATYFRLLKALRPHLPLFCLGLFGTLLAAITDASITWGIKPLIDKGFVDQDPVFIYWLPFIIIPVFIFRGLTSFTSQYCITRVGRNIVTYFRQRIFAHLLTMPASFFDKTTCGALLSLINYNTEQVAEASTFALLTMVQEGGLIIGLMVVMFIQSWQLSLLFLLSAPIIAIVVRYSSRRLRTLSSNVQNVMGNITQVSEETIEGYKVVRTFGGEQYEQNKFNKVTEFARFQELKVVITNTLSSSSVQLIAAIPISITLYLATSPVFHITAGSFGSLIVAMIQLLRPMRRITRVNTMIQKGVAGAASVFHLLDQPTEQDHGTRTVERVAGNIEFNNVNFHYESNKQVVLHDINLDIQAGQTVALVGKSGSGKSTMVSLLPRFYDVISGDIFIDGHNVNEYKLASLRQQFSFVSQHVSLFNDTIAANIAYGFADDVSKTQLIEVAKAAHALEFIEQLPQGFDTEIGENGVLLSGGQRQRLAIARALLKDAPILIFDEATSALDTESERHIQDALETLMRGRTTIVIAHRLSTIEQADKIFVIDQGRIIESGTHAQLLANNMHYTKLHSGVSHNEQQTANTKTAEVNTLL